MSKREYIQSLENVILERHACKSAWVESVPVVDVFRGQTIWNGSVEVFRVSGHDKAKIAYAWIEHEEQAEARARVETVLQIRPVDSPLSAVQGAIIADTMWGL